MLISHQRKRSKMPLMTLSVADGSELASTGQVSENSHYNKSKNRDYCVSKEDNYSLRHKQKRLNQEL